MTLKHIEFYDSPVMIELAKNAIKKGTVKPSVSDVVSRVAGVNKYAATDDLFADLIRLADGLRERGLLADANSLETKIVNYKRASIMDEAHPDGDVLMGEAHDELGMVETHESAHKKIEEVARRQPTGKNASLTAMILKMAESVLVKSADDKMWSDEENKTLTPEAKKTKALEKLNTDIQKYFNEISSELSAVTILNVDDAFSYKNILQKGKETQAFSSLNNKTDTKSIFDLADFIKNVCANVYGSTIESCFDFTIVDKIKSFNLSSQLENINNIRKLVELQPIQQLEQNEVNRTADTLRAKLNSKIGISNISQIQRINGICKTKVDDLSKTIIEAQTYFNTIPSFEDFKNVSDVVSAMIFNAKKIENKSGKDDVLQKLSIAYDFGYNKFLEVVNKGVAGRIRGYASQINNILSLIGEATVVTDERALLSLDTVIKQLNFYVSKGNPKKAQIEQIISTLNGFKGVLEKSGVGSKYDVIKDEAKKLFTDADTYEGLVNEIQGLVNYYKSVFKEAYVDYGRVKLAIPTAAIGGGSPAPVAPGGTPVGATKSQAKGGIGTPEHGGGTKDGAPDVTKAVLDMQNTLKTKYKLTGFGSIANPDEPDGVWGKLTSDALKTTKISGLDTNIYWLQPGSIGGHRNGAKQAAEKNTQLLGGQVASGKAVKSELYDLINVEGFKKNVSTIGDAMLMTGVTKVMSYDLNSLANLNEFLLREVYAYSSGITNFSFDNYKAFIQFFKVRSEYLIAMKNPKQPPPPNPTPDVANLLENITIESAQRYNDSVRKLFGQLLSAYQNMPEPRNTSAPMPTGLLGRTNGPEGFGRPQHRGIGPDGNEFTIAGGTSPAAGNPDMPPVSDVLYLDSPYFMDKISKYKISLPAIRIADFRAYPYENLLYLLRPVKTQEGTDSYAKDLYNTLSTRYGNALNYINQEGRQSKNGQALWAYANGVFYIRSTPTENFQPFEDSTLPAAIEIKEKITTAGKTFDLEGFLKVLRDSVQQALHQWMQYMQQTGKKYNPNDIAKLQSSSPAWIEAIQNKLNEITSARGGGRRSGRGGVRSDY